MTDLEKIATDCRAAQIYYADRPAEAVDPSAIVDIYAQIANLARAVERRIKFIDNSLPIQPCGVSVDQHR
jgi:hypothetical protein